MCKVVVKLWGRKQEPNWRFLLFLLDWSNLVGEQSIDNISSDWCFM
ncbi:hypothetical protein N781_08140 [Pontibacillus halophilus JSM 076056 = DSM 19796]|uniref:Uncharacterized protein n=1 Tax=Pontibacillus halophilus JSM 076056 = DSM 19796 TaxID=1385510 RepID=A0A0A5GE23_9BACI|nr:hypothetical protein N781_08140 [Pontibacillus halophilus JSM 076056 = DSM 19796]